MAISEFGPRSIIYHEGARYRVNRVIISPDLRESSENDDELTIQAKRCEECGYLHAESLKADICENCKSALSPPIQSLFRLTNVATQRLDRINADEEERVRLGYDVLTGYRFSARSDGDNRRVSEVLSGETCIAVLTYGHAAELWRINLGWRRRANKDSIGFGLDVESGRWCSEQAEVSYNEDEDRPPDGPLVKRVVPFVQDNRNCLIFNPTGASELSISFMASLQSALKKGIQAVCQVEDMELAVEPLPSYDDRRMVLIYESAEGGAGVLRQLVENPARLKEVANEALSICHFNPETGEDLGKAIHASEECTVACYDCLMDYANQPDHQDLSRHDVRDFLMDLSGSKVDVGSGELPRQSAYERLLDRCDSQLERDFVTFIYENGYRLPDDSQTPPPDIATKPDFSYHTPKSVIYVDGPPHDHPERQERDKAQTLQLEDAGYWVVRVQGPDTWQDAIDQYADIFGDGTV